MPSPSLFTDALPQRQWKIEDEEIRDVLMNLMSGAENSLYENKDTTDRPLHDEDATEAYVLSQPSNALQSNSGGVIDGENSDSPKKEVKYVNSQEFINARADLPPSYYSISGKKVVDTNRAPEFVRRSRSFPTRNGLTLNEWNLRSGFRSRARPRVGNLISGSIFPHPPLSLPRFGMRLLKGRRGVGPRCGSKSCWTSRVVKPIFASTSFGLGRRDVPTSR